VNNDRLYRVSRTGHGCTVHLPTCYHLAKAQRSDPWNWAEGRTIAEVLRASWNHPCGTCLALILDDRGLNVSNLTVRQGRLTKES
jgi:hypothetical protein